MGKKKPKKQEKVFTQVFLEQLFGPFDGKKKPKKK